MKKKIELDETFVVRAKKLDYGQLLPMLNRLPFEDQRRVLGSFIDTLNDFYKKQGFDIKIQ